MSVIFKIKGTEYKARPSLSALREYGNIIGTNKINEVIKSLSFENPEELSFDDLDKIGKLIAAGIKVETGAHPELSDILDYLLPNMEQVTYFMNQIMESFTTPDEKKNKVKTTPKKAT
jgi:hypothetical protein